MNCQKKKFSRNSCAQRIYMYISIRKKNTHNTNYLSLIETSNEKPQKIKWNIKYYRRFIYINILVGWWYQ